MVNYTVPILFIFLLVFLLIGIPQLPNFIQRADNINMIYLALGSVGMLIPVGLLWKN